MNKELKLKVIQKIYTELMAESIFYYNEEGILGKITKEKKQKSLILGKKLVEQFNIKNIEGVFLWVSEIFGCAIWDVEQSDNIILAVAKECKLCSTSKKLGCAKPCYMYCLNPIEGMVKAIDPKSKFEILETLWEGEKCKVRVKRY